MMLSGFGIILAFFYIFSVVNAQKYFVRLKTAKTLDTLFKFDDIAKTNNHLRDCVQKKISFGDFEGFSGDFTKDIIQKLETNPLIADITPDIIVKALDDDAVEIEPENSSKEAPRHLVRLSQQEKIQEGQAMKYHYDPEFEGQNVNAYVIDTGVFVEHPEFEGRASVGADFTGSGIEDVQGHGTHVAGIIGSKTFGVAKQINIVAVKVLDNYGTGSLSSVIEGLEYAVNHMKKSGLPGVANLSLGAIKNSVLNNAISAAYGEGLIVVCAAGNANINACEDSPASSPFSIAVGAIDDRSDNIASFSNWGECVNIFASGVYVESLYNRNVYRTVLMSGTSMSSPSVAGQVGILLSQGIDPKEIADTLYDLSTQDAIPSSAIDAREGTPNRLVYNGYGWD
ncbi:hypothetical protein PACTADRAFT_4530 [Pachysolen tannophilus NRRL Y-2460]|uniref:Peptidase S8/S53 domain-containing protein n=1 Tax=Pachysolen tannophilus NRRL Y-2460 TaxID=669874 RepID=A0A1E4TPF8_PACTA|nr:hypothetical protein PACTADRAFT_4530 [Pachysolen tannophilus NRRL Y-2460]